MPLIEIADYNRDGMFDLIYARAETNEIVVLLNQLPAVSAKSMDLCREDPNSSRRIFVSNPAKTSADKALVMKSESSLNLAPAIPGVPGRLRLAELNSDGYPEIIATLLNQDGSTKTQIFANSLQPGDNQNEKPTKLIQEEDMSELADLAGSSALFITFVDIDEDGKVDFLVQHQSQSQVPSLNLIYNNLHSDSFFIKALMLNSKQEKFTGDNIYGDSANGASYRFVVTDLEDNKYVAVGSQ